MAGSAASSIRSGRGVADTETTTAAATPKAGSTAGRDSEKMKGTPVEAPGAAVSATADPEAQQATNFRGHFAMIFDQSGVTDNVLNYKYHGSGTTDSPYVVDFLPGGDSHNPMQFSNAKKWGITAVQAWATLAVAFASSAISGGLSEIVADFQISSELATLCISLFVVGFSVGPLGWAPLSELFGRQKLYFVSFAGLSLFSAGAAGAQNIQTLIILRFFGGAFGSSPLANSGGVIADMFPASERGFATSLYAIAPFLGPALGPIASGFLGVAGGWRWIEGLMAAFTGLLWIIGTLYVPETYAPVLLRRRAVALSKKTGKVYISKMDVGKPVKTVAQEFKVSLSRPFILLFTEPIVLLTSLYMAIVYGTLYMLFGAYPIVFQVQHGWAPGIGGLAFVGVAVGMLAAVSYSIFDNKRYIRAVVAKNGSAAPEDRLPPALIGAVLLPVGLFWFAWTNGLNVHWIVPMIAGGFFAAGLCLVFLALLNYLIDSYVVFAASVLAANSLLRSLFGAAFPLFTTQMYANLGIHWASSVPAFLALACLPLPFLFYRWGYSIRMKCKFAAEAAQILEVMRRQHRVVDEDEAMKEADEHERLQKAEKTRSQNSHRAAQGLSEITELVRTRTQREHDERERARALRAEATEGTRDL